MLTTSQTIAVSITDADRPISRIDLESYWKRHATGIREDFLSGKIEYLHFQESGRIMHFYPLWKAKQQLYYKLGPHDAEPPDYEDEYELNPNSGITYSPGDSSGLPSIGFYFGESEAEIDSFMSIITDFVGFFLKQLEK